MFSTFKATEDGLRSHIESNMRAHWERLERVRDLYARADVTVPVGPGLAVVGGVGYENVEVSNRDVVRDTNGDPVLGADGRFLNVWRGRHFYTPGGPHASMAGRHATRQLAKNRLDGDPDYAPDEGKPLNPAERASLACLDTGVAS